MNIINLSEILFLLEEKKVESIFIKINDETNVEINRKLSIYFNFDDLNDKKNGQMLDRGFQINYDGKTVDCENLDQLFKFLDLDNQKSIELININNQFESINKYIEDKEFKDLDMQGIIKKYENLADSFVLVVPYDDRLILEDINLNEEYGAKTVKDLEEHIIKRLKSLYEKQYEDIKRTTSKSFETLINEIKEEIFLDMKRAEKNNNMVFLCDKVYDEKTKYYMPKEFFWHVYQDLQFLFMCQKDMERKILLREKSPENNLDIEDLKLLKPYLISVALSYSWHCTTTSQLSIVFKFKLTDETKKYLLQFKTDYDLKQLEDLALYKGDKLLFSSCTHEQFHVDFSKNL